MDSPILHLGADMILSIAIYVNVRCLSNMRLVCKTFNTMLSKQSISKLVIRDKIVFDGIVALLKRKCIDAFDANDRDTLIFFLYDIGKSEEEFMKSLTNVEKSDDITFLIHLSDPKTSKSAFIEKLPTLTKAEGEKLFRLYQNTKIDKEIKNRRQKIILAMFLLNISTSEKEIRQQLWTKKSGLVGLKVFYGELLLLFNRVHKEFVTDITPSVDIDTAGINWDDRSTQMKVVSRMIPRSTEIVAKRKTAAELISKLRTFLEKIDASE